MKNSKWIFILVTISIIGTAIVYPYLPAQVPAQWNSSGEVSRYHDKIWSFAMALLPLMIYLMMKYLPKIDPKRASYEKHQKAYKVTQILLVIVMVMFHWLAIVAALGVNLDVGVFVRIIIGVMFIILGNYMSQIRQNYFFGIKTPWTLASEEVWKKTHRVGAYAFSVMGISMLLTLRIPGKASGIIVTSVGIIGVGFTYVYSYLVFKKISK